MSPNIASRMVNLALVQTILVFIMLQFQSQYGKEFVLNLLRSVWFRQKIPSHFLTSFEVIHRRKKTTNFVCWNKRWKRNKYQKYRTTRKCFKFVNQFSILIALFTSWIKRLFSKLNWCQEIKTNKEYNKYP